MEIWLPNQSIGWEEALNLGEVVSVGKSIVGDWQSTFVIPAYVAEANPGLKTPQDLAKPEYNQLFATSESRGKARLVACVPGWSCELANDAQIETYGLTDHLYVVKPGSQDAMFAEVFGAYEKQEPWLGYMWGTGDPGIKLDLVPLEEAAYTKECWDTDKACAFDESLVLVAVHPSLLPRASDLVAFLQKWDFGVPTYKEVFHWMDQNEGSTSADGAIYWLEQNSDLWSSWLPEEAAARVQAALTAGEKAEGWPAE
jgi:glycine betaine/proline transport system substrate-binding protein